MGKSNRTQEAGREHAQMMPSATEPAFVRLFPGDSEMARRMRELDWSRTDLGPPAAWPENLRTAVSICLTSRFPIFLWWGPNYTLLYNDAYIPVLGPTKHPQWLGRSGRDCWHDIWDIVGPLAESVTREGEATWSEELLLVMDRHLPHEETYFTFSYSPILTGDATGVGGMFCACTETTDYVLARRRLGTLRELGRRAAKSHSATTACQRAADVLADNPYDSPFAAIYLVDTTAGQATLSASVRGDGSFPPAVSLHHASDAWPVARVWNLRKPEDVRLRDGTGFQGGAWPEKPQLAVVLPIVVPGIEGIGGVLVAGINPRRPLDAAYRDFFGSITTQLGSAIAEACAYEAERKRAESLAEIDRAKTAFFSNVSHEFRTPLTLMLAPLQDCLDAPDLPEHHRQSLEVAHRNSLRLLRLVNTLLDFSRIEAGRADASYEQLDAAELTEDLASSFRSAIERAGLAYRVRCEQARSPIFLDRQMWEKIVLNLLSNAFKFTLQGSIDVELFEQDGRLVLSVRDTGVGIPAAELAHVFERFHRVRGTGGRTHEGTGIGLALVSELVKLHGGGVEVESRVGAGTTFRVAIPAGSAHLPADRIGVHRGTASTALGAAPFVEEALRWLPEADDAVANGFAPETDKLERVTTTGAQVLVADDNADMRSYLARLLRQYWSVQVATDGQEALAILENSPVDLVLSDLMMPRLDGIGLLRAIRSDAGKRFLPVILLSARAGEESRVEGIACGADDYLTKPFSARELLARVNAHLEMAGLRREAAREREDLLARETAARSEAEKANRAKDSFLAVLSHELRSPMNAMLGWLQILKTAGASDPDLVRRAADTIERNVWVQSQIVNDLLDVSRIISGKLQLETERVDIASVVMGSVESLRPSAEGKKIALRLSLQDGGPEALEVMGDNARLQQVLTNLVGNAIKFTEAGGTITVTLEGGDGVVRLIVEDDGHGIEAGFLPHLFERFRQADSTTTRRFGGLGLGLAIVKNVVGLHGGHVEARSDGPGRGATFTVELPRAKSRPRVAPRVEAPPPLRETAAPIDILLVEDDDDSREAFEMALEEIGACVRSAPSVQEALDAYDARPPDVLISDISMPDGDGYVLIRQIRQREEAGSHRTLAIAITGFAGRQDREMALRAGFDEHVGKPVEPEILFERVRVLDAALRGRKRTRLQPSAR